MSDPGSYAQEQSADTENRVDIGKSRHHVRIFRVTISYFKPDPAS